VRAGMRLTLVGSGETRRPRMRLTLVGSGKSEGDTLMRELVGIESIYDQMFHACM